MNTRKLINRPGRMLAGLFIFLALGLLVSPGSLACHKGNPHGKDAPPDCSSGNPPPDTPDVIATWGGEAVIQGFAGDGINEPADRQCLAIQLAEDDSSGTYDCELNNVDIYHNFDYMASMSIHRRGDDWRCEPNVSGAWLRPDLEYRFSWTGDCTVEPGCNITVFNRYSNIGVIGTSVDKVTLEAFAFDFMSDSSNPFAESQSVPIEVLHYTMFSHKGNNKILAKCELIPHDDWPVVLHTDPME